MKINYKKVLKLASVSALAVGTLAVAASVFGVPLDALAAASSFAEGTANIGKAAVNVPGIVSVAGYAAGGASFIAGAGKFKAHSDNPSQTPLSAGLSRMAVGAVLVGAPAVANTLLQNGLATNPQTVAGYKGLNASSAAATFK